MLFEELVPNTNLEDYEVKFKGIINEGFDNETKQRVENGWLKEIAAFANTFGGVLYVGVENKTHKIVALSHECADKIALMVQRLIPLHIEPPIRYTIEKIPVPEVSPTRYVLGIHVEKSKFPPVSLHINGTSVIYVRHFGKTSPATGEEIRNLVLSSDSVSYDIMETDEFFHKEDFQTLFSFYKEQNNGKELTEKDLLNIGFFTLDKKLKRGAILFRDDCNDPRTLIECSAFPGISKGDNLFLASKKIQGNLIEEYKEAMDFIESRSVNGFEKTPNGRKDIFSFPKRSLSEGIANAIGHRNYFIQGGQIEINVFKDRLEIISPGSLPTHKWLQKETNLAQIPPLRRNELICAVFSLCKIMDHKGSGFDKIEQEYKEYGPKFAPFADSDDSIFSLTLPDLTHPSGLVLNNEKPVVYTINGEETAKQLEILSYCWNAPHTALEIAEMLGIKPSNYFRKEILQPLMEKNLLLMSNSTYPAKYYSNHNTVFPK